MSGSDIDRDDNSSSRGAAGKLKSPRASSGGAGSGGGGGQGADSCDIREPAPLNSPKPAVVEKLKVGDVLDIVVDSTSGRAILRVLDRSGSEAGSLTHRHHATIIECIDQGNTYVATVIEKAGGAITVLIERA